MNYKESVAYLFSAPRLTETASQEPLRRLLAALGDPQKGQKYIHITGTNGKGSCAAMLASVLRASKYRVGLFTSPHLYRVNERLQINGREIGDEAFAALISELRAAAEKERLTLKFFELVTAAALLWFARESCDVAVLEAGLGGASDATNVIDAPELAVIMNVGLDHTELLGDTVEAIAEEKAGIIKPGCDCVLYQQSESVTELVRARCELMGARLHIPDFLSVGSEFDSVLGQSFTYKGEPYALPLPGDHQLRNAATVLEAAAALNGRGWKLRQGDIEHGLYAVSWPARMELLRAEPPFLLDGAHNPQCAEALKNNLLRYFPDQKRVLLVGMLRDKDCVSTLSLLAEAADEFVCIAPDSPRAMSAEELAELLRPMGRPVTVSGSIREGIELAAALAGEDGVVCAAGSLYSAGEIRYQFGMY